MARGNRTPFYLGLSALFYFALLFSPLAFVHTAHAQEEAVQESYGTGMYHHSVLFLWHAVIHELTVSLPQSLVSISEPPTPALV
jgi:hypothetical protein